MQGKGINPHEIDSRIASSSTPLSNHTGNSILDSVCHQGGSLINAWCAAMATTAVSTHLFSQNDTLHFNGTQPLSIINKGKHAVSCTVDHVTAGTTLALEKHNVPNHWSVRPIPGTAVLSFSLNFSAQMHHSMLINLFVCIKSHTIPYYGVGAALKKRPGNLYPQTMLTAIRKTLPYPHNQLAYDAYSQNCRKSQLV
ncbi:hypothetical protein VP01_696g1 [Puccinia sorghi]|uniref:Uncharacterized protein n=1 Tax=Puccinia sorghi TaxID=27349 RepID=A0A0L6UG51_9BASI|nr:hypothetical protein VP01_696g1 [Puccinia sorghi]